MWESEFYDFVGFVFQIKVQDPDSGIVDRHQELYLSFNMKLILYLIKLKHISLNLLEILKITKIHEFLSEYR